MPEQKEKTAAFAHMTEGEVRDALTLAAVGIELSDRIISQLTEHARVLEAQRGAFRSGHADATLLLVKVREALGLPDGVALTELPKRVEARTAEHRGLLHSKAALLEQRDKLHAQLERAQGQNERLSAERNRLLRINEDLAWVSREHLEKEPGGPWQLAPHRNAPGVPRPRPSSEIRTPSTNIGITEAGGHARQAPPIKFAPTLAERDREARRRFWLRLRRWWSRQDSPFDVG